MCQYDFAHGVEIVETQRRSVTTAWFAGKSGAP
jgi:hypothetical protein